MERMTRLSALLLAGGLSVGTLAGCSRQAPSDVGASAASESPAAAETPAPAETPAASESGTASSGAEGDAAAGGNVLVVYYSASGHTEAVAQTIAEATSGDLFEITPAEPYTDDDLDWTNENSRVSQEYADESLRDVELAAATAGQLGQL